jgi:endo-1,3(4)-beta-glucanase
LVLKLKNNVGLHALKKFTGTIQIAKNPKNVAANELAYDSCAGSYAKSVAIDGAVNGATGSYTFKWTKGGGSSPLMMFALPHHQQSLDYSSVKKSGIKLQTTTKGTALGIIGDKWTMKEPNLPISIGFAPWRVASKNTASIPQTAIKIITKAATGEISQDMAGQSNLNSMYFSGKALSKFASIVYAVHDLTGNTSLASAGLSKLKKAFARFADNKQIYPLVYESAWGGIVSTGAYVTGDSGVDFGGSYYNDHHFHYGYFVHTAAIIGYLDPSWLASNKDWVNTLVRDVANPSTKDPYFPQSRSFDWFHGHSWAKGLFDSADGKDQESTSGEHTKTHSKNHWLLTHTDVYTEDALFAFAMKMWGQIIKNTAMEARGNLMLAVQKRSFSNYFLLESTNTNQPANFIQNKVTGILFENKVDHTTYFGANIEYIQGIHMIPISPFSSYTRSQKFMEEEWTRYFDNGRVDKVSGGWRGILYSNLALIDAKAAWKWFSKTSFDPQYLDGGASLTWYLALAAGLGGAA